MGIRWQRERRRRRWWWIWRRLLIQRRQRHSFGGIPPTRCDLEAERVRSGRRGFFFFYKIEQMYVFCKWSQPCCSFTEGRKWMSACNFCMSWLMLAKFGVEELRLIPLGGFDSFVKSNAVKGVLDWRACVKCCLYRARTSSGLHEIRYWRLLEKPLISHEFRENRCSERCTLLNDVNTNLPTFSAFFFRFGWNSAQEMCTKILNDC